MTEMKIYKAIFACVLVAIILVPVSFDRDPAGHGPGLILSWTESRAGAGKADLSGKAGLPNSRPADANGGSIGSHSRLWKSCSCSPLTIGRVRKSAFRPWCGRMFLPRMPRNGLIISRPRAA